MPDLSVMSWVGIVFLLVLFSFVIRAMVQDRSTSGIPRQTIPLSPEQEQKICTLIRDKKLIDAIKVYSEETGSDLRTARDGVEELGRRYMIL